MYLALVILLLALEETQAYFLFFSHSESNFVANPEAKSEDDGVLVTIGYDGMKGRSYLLLLDAMTFEPLNYAYSPHRIPYSFHGNFFGEA